MLAAFDAVARHKSFSRAAAQLNLTQAAISYRIRILEEQLGVELLSRTQRPIALTPAGRKYWVEIGAALGSIEDATARLIQSEASGQSTQLRFLAMQAFASLWLLPRLPRFQTRNPDLKVMLVSWIVSSDRMDSSTFVQQGLDASIMYMLPSIDSPGVTKELLIPDYAVPVCSPSLATRKKPLRTVPDLRRHTILHALNWPDTWQSWLKAAGEPGLRPQAEVFLQHTALTTEAALHGMGVAIAHAPLIYDHLKTGRLITPFKSMLPIDQGYYLLYPSVTRDNNGVRLLADWLRSEFDRITPYLKAQLSTEFKACR
ncbi:MAG: LysR family transcriptional regulator [Hyphomicrobiaceae bacterium]|nr:LysR family transcriptional regulator [Hyphomicrobiaceae bacterium]